MVVMSVWMVVMIVDGGDVGVYGGADVDTRYLNESVGMHGGVARTHVMHAPPAMAACMSSIEDVCIAW